MMRRIVGASQRLRLLVIPVAVATMLLGGFQLRDAAVDVLPEFNRPTVRIQTEALGLSAAEVEQLVTVPLEQNLLNGVAWLEEIHSESLTGLSSIELVFQPGTDVLNARQMVQERLAHAHTLPNVSKLPAMLQPISSANRVLMVELSSTSVSMIDQSVLARWRIKPRLLGISGVANVSIWGQRERQLQVQVDPEKLRALGVTLNQVTETTANALWVSPLTYVEASTPGSGGFIDGPNQRLGIRHVLPITDAADLARVVVDRTGANPLRLGDVATVVEDHQPLIGDAVVDGGRGLTLVIEKFPDANAREVTAAVEAALASMAVGLPGVTVDTRPFQPASFIASALNNLGRVLLLGLALLLVVFLLLFAGWRGALTGLLSVLASLGSAVIALNWLGVTFNAMILIGLVMALGVIVDEAVVSVEQVRWRLRQQDPSSDVPLVEAVRTALVGVRIPMMAATLAVLATAVPLFLWNGVAGAFLGPTALAYVFAVAAAIVVAFTVTPALAAVLLTRPPRRVRSAGLLSRGYRAVVGPMAARPRIGYAIVAALILAGVAATPALSGSGLLPAMRERDLLVNWTAATGTSRTEIIRITDTVTNELRAISGVRNVGAHIGRAITSDEVTDVHSGQLWVNIDPKADYDRTIAAVTQSVNGYPGIRAEIRGYHNEILATAHSRVAPDEVRVRIYGNDATVLSDKAVQVRDLVAEVSGVTSASVDQPAAAPTIEIKVDLAQAQKHGLKPGDVRRAAATLVSGVEVGSIFEDQKVFDVLVVGVPDLRLSLTTTENLLIDKPDNTQVRLRDVADVSVTTSQNVIRHHAVSRYVDVTAQVGAGDRDAVAKRIQGQLRGVTFPSEHHAEILGGATGETNDLMYVLILILGAAVAVVLLIQVVFASWRLALLAFLSILAATTGGLFAAVGFGGGAMTLATIAGLLAVVAIAIRWTVATVRQVQDRVAPGERAGAALVQQVAVERFKPIVTTTLGLGLALAPLFLVGDIPGLEVVRPLAVVLLGGLVTAAVVNLLAVPALCLHAGSADTEASTSQPQPGPQANPTPASV